MKTRMPLLLVVMALVSLVAALSLPATGLGKPFHSSVGAVTSLGPLSMVWTLQGVAVAAGLLVLSNSLWRRFRGS